jgi:hypothetical protein
MILKIMEREKFQNHNLKFNSKKKKKKALISIISLQKILIWMKWWISLNSSAALEVLLFNLLSSHKYINQAVINILISKIWVSLSLIHKMNLTFHNTNLSLIHKMNLTFHNTNLNHNTSPKYKIILINNKSEALNII